MQSITKTLQGQEVEFSENDKGMWSYRLIGAIGWRGIATKPVFHTQIQAEGRAKKFIDQYYAAQSND
jgi:hypothetical protein